GRLVDGCRLDSGDLVLPQRLAHDVEPARERRIAEAAFVFPWPASADGGGQRLFWIDEFRLGLGQGRGQRCDRFTGPGLGLTPSPEHQSSLPPIPSALLPRRVRWPPSHPPASRL